jgi:hypothetical protein
MAPDSNATKKTPENLFFIDLKQRVKKRNPFQLMDNLDTRERSRETPGSALPPGCGEIWITSGKIEYRTGNFTHNRKTAIHHDHTYP